MAADHRGSATSMLPSTAPTKAATVAFGDEPGEGGLVARKQPRDESPILGRGRVDGVTNPGRSHGPSTRTWRSLPTAKLRPSKSGLRSRLVTKAVLP